MMEYPDFANLAIIRHDPDMPPEPLTDDECRDMLRSTLHGPLPAIIMHRVFATLAEMPTLRQRAETAERRLSIALAALRSIAGGVRMVEQEAKGSGLSGADRFVMWNSHNYEPDQVPGMRRARELDADELQRLARDALLRADDA